jgi:hypothetical protein
MSVPLRHPIRSGGKNLIDDVVVEGEQITVHWRQPMRRLLKFAGFLLIGGVLIAVAVPVGADEPPGCLPQEQRRATTAAHQALPLARAVRAARSHLRGEIVRARLCVEGNGLVYVVTLLDHDGKVTRAKLDASSGAYLGGR